MLPTVDALVRRLPADLVPVAPARAVHTPVTGVHVSELPDPTRFLDGGELLLTTGLGFNLDARSLSAYVRRLTRHGVTALALGLGPVLAEVPAPLLRAAERYGLPFLVVPPVTPFLTISREYWRLAAEDTRRELTAAIAGHRALIADALTRDPVRAMLRRLGASVGGWAALVPPDPSVGSVLAEPAAKAPVDALVVELTARGATGGSATLTTAVGREEVVVHPLGGGDRPLGYLAIGSVATVPSTAAQLVTTAVALLSLHQAGSGRLRSAQRGVPSAVLTELVHGHVSAAGRLARSWGVSLPGEVTAVLVDAPDPDEVLDRLEIALPRRHLLLGGTVDAVAMALLAPASGPTQAAQRAVAGVGRARAVVLTPCAPADLPGAVAQARRILADLDRGVVVDLADPVAAAPLDTAPMRSWARARVEPLRRAGEDLVPTLVAFLRCRGEQEATARALGVHRHTVRNRIDRVEHILSARLADPDVAADLWVALRLCGLA